MQIRQVTVEDYRAERGAGVVLLDVREPAEWAAGHAAEAVHIPMNNVPAALAADPDRFDAASSIVVTCKVGGRSAQVTAYLNQHGIPAVNLEGGMLAWEAAGLPMVSETGDAAEVL